MLLKIASDDYQIYHESKICILINVFKLKITFGLLDILIIYMSTKYINYHNCDMLRSTVQSLDTHKNNKKLFFIYLYFIAFSIYTHISLLLNITIIKINKNKKNS